MPGKLHLLVHVPKCAGTSVEQHLRKHLGAAGAWLPPKRTRQLPLELFGRKYESEPPGRREDIRAISGHFIGQSIARQFPDRSIVRSMILRQPEQQMLSHYNYRMMRYLKSGQRPYPFEDHLYSMPVAPVAHFLLERWLEMPWPRMAAISLREKARLLDEALAQFDRIVDISEADAHIAWLSRDLGIPEATTAKNTSTDWQATTGWKPLKLDELSEADRAAMARRLALDRYLWRRWALKEDVRFDERDSGGFLIEELRRPAYQIRRRLRRGAAA